jgi:hypothetical protein
MDFVDRMDSVVEISVLGPYIQVCDATHSMRTMRLFKRQDATGRLLGYRRAQGVNPPGTEIVAGWGTLTAMAVSAEDVRRLALSLPRAYEVLVADRVKFRVGRLVFLTFSRDETLMGFGFPREERTALVAAEPHKFRMPRTSDLRYNWVVASLDQLDPEEMRELVIDAWRMVVPKRVVAEYLEML